MPLSSMTGFASVAGEHRTFDWRWDLRSVNARGLDLRFRMPAGYEMLEPKLRKTAQQTLKRGTVSANLTIKTQAVALESQIDDSALSSVILALYRLRSQLQEAGVPMADVQAETLLSLPGVMSADEHEDVDDRGKLEQALLSGFASALDGLITERRNEGVRLASIISEQVTQIESLSQDAAECAEDAVQVLRERARTQIESVLADTSISPDRLEAEVAVLAVKADVREEIDRLNAHVAAARDLLASDEPVGRRLDFLTQEFNREANTLCSKSPTDQLTRIGLELKTVIDQMREQAANIE